MSLQPEIPIAGAEHQASEPAIDAVVFDMDGVLTQTAAVHSSAWKQMFDEYLASRAKRLGEPFREFDHSSDYLPYVDGRPRYEGVETFLHSRGIRLPLGDPSDSPTAETVCGLGNRKNQIFNQLLATGGVAVYQTTVDLIHSLREHGVRIALATSSRNSSLILGSTGTTHLFEVIVDGISAERMGLKGKPNPDIFLAACAAMGVQSRRSVVVEDAVPGVAAGVNGGFGLTIGVARAGNRAELAAQGADVVVDDLGETDFEDICRRTLEKRRLVELQSSPHK